jgi:hypothetical protein
MVTAGRKTMFNSGTNTKDRKVSNITNADTKTNINSNNSSGCGNNNDNSKLELVIMLATNEIFFPLDIYYALLIMKEDKAHQGL